MASIQTIFNSALSKQKCSLTFADSRAILVVNLFEIKNSKQSKCQINNYDNQLTLYNLYFDTSPPWKVTSYIYNYLTITSNRNVPLLVCALLLNWAAPCCVLMAHSFDPFSSSLVSFLAEFSHFTQHNILYILVPFMETNLYYNGFIWGMLQDKVLIDLKSYAKLGNPCGIIVYVITFFVNMQGAANYFLSFEHLTAYLLENLCLLWAACYFLVFTGCLFYTFCALVGVFQYSTYRLVLTFVRLIQHAENYQDATCLYTRF